MTAFHKNGNVQLMV